MSKKLKTKKQNRIRVFFVFCFLFFCFKCFALTSEEICTRSTTNSGICPVGATCAMLPKCQSNCISGCQKGYYLSDGDGDHTNNYMSGILKIKGICELCPPGFYCLGGMKDKIACPVGTYNPKPGATLLADCLSPTKTGYCVARGQLSGLSIVTFPNSCIGSQSVHNNDVSATTAHAVITGYTDSSNVGANLQIPCPAGSYKKNDSTCELCPAGTYQGLAAQTSCITCPAGSVTNTLTSAGATSCSPCLPGKYSPNSQSRCVDCTSGNEAIIVPGSGASTCTPCDVGYIDDDSNSSTACVVCPIGTFKSDAGQIGPCDSAGIGYCTSKNGTTCSGAVTGSTSKIKCTGDYYSIGTQNYACSVCSHCVRVSNNLHVGCSLEGFDASGNPEFCDGADTDCDGNYTEECSSQWCYCSDLRGSSSVTFNMCPPQTGSSSNGCYSTTWTSSTCNSSNKLTASVRGAFNKFKVYGNKEIMVECKDGNNSDNQLVTAKASTTEQCFCWADGGYCKTQDDSSGVWLDRASNCSSSSTTSSGSDY